MELQILDWIQTIHTDLLDRMMVLVTALGESGIFWILVGLVLVCMEKYRKYGLMIWATLLCGLLIGNLMLKNLIARPRPYTMRPDLVLLVKQPWDYSFPSGHTLCSFEAAGVLWFMNRRIGTAALILAGLIGFSRMYLYVHYPTDVLAGMILGLLIAYCVTRFWLHMERKGHCSRLS